MNIKGTCLAFLLAAGAHNSWAQVHRPGLIVTNDDDKASTARQPVVDLGEIETLRQIAAASPTERIRATRYNSDDDHIPPLYDPKTRKSVLPERSIHYLGRESLPAQRSDVIAIGVVNSASSHVSLDGTMLYSVFSFTPSEILKGSVSKGLPIVLERIGGVARYPNGVKRFVGESGVGLPEIGRKYLLFLRAVPDSHDFRIEAGFFIDAPNPVALDAIGDHLEKEPTASLIQATTLKVKNRD